MVGPPVGQQVTVLTMNGQPGQPRVVRVSLAGGCILGAWVRIHEDLLTPGNFIANIGPDSPFVIGALDAQGTPLPGAAPHEAVPSDGLLTWSLSGGEAACPQVAALAFGLQSGGQAWVESVGFMIVPPAL